MKKALMNRVVPYESSYESLSKWRRVGSALLYLVLGLSLLGPILTSRRDDPGILRAVESISTILNILAIVGFYCVNTVTETFIYPATAHRRRLGFIDNSFGSKLLGKDLKGYFANDSLPLGMYKMTVNCFENCFFTYSIACGMTAWLVAKNAALASIFLVFAYYGFRENVIAVPLLQMILSAAFLTNLIHHLNFRSKLSSLLGRFRHIMADTPVGDRPSSFPTAGLALVLEYETTLAYNTSPLSDRVYERINEKATEDWEELKRYYDI